MTQQQIANAAVLITQILKTNQQETAQVVRQKIVDQLADYLTVNQIQELFFKLFEELDINYNDIDDGIAVILTTGLQVTSDIQHNVLWQEIGQGLYYLLNIIKGFLPPKWEDVIVTVLTAYKALKES